MAGKTGSRQVLQKLKKSFLVKKSSAKQAGKASAEQKDEVAGKAGAEKKEDAEKGEGPMKGKLVRVVDEDSMYCGNVVEVMGHAKGKLHGQVSWKDADAICLEKVKCPPSVCLDATKVLLLAEIPKPQLTPWKPLRFKDEERAEAEILFLPEELETGYKLSKEES